MYNAQVPVLVYVYIKTKESQSVRYQLSQADTSGVERSEMNAGKSRIFEPIDDAILIFFRNYIKQLCILQKKYADCKGETSPHEKK